MAPGSGQSLLHYVLVDKLGEGGMGVVWRARDASLGRETAIKVLPEGVAADGERLARFEREARLLATLNHPNIAAVYGLHEADGVRFIAMELVEGEDLAARIGRGALSSDEAIDIARQVAAGLEAAHESGVIHRDLKPANVRIAPDGTVKVLDFGLAKALSPDAGSSGVNPSLSPTLTSVGSMAGLILGTAAYMSPEQAKGRAVDRRADIWSFGCLLYEMLAGRSTFAGETVSEILASVLKDDVDWDALPAGTPPAVRRLLRRCLDRDPATRLRDIGEARVALTGSLDEPPVEEPAPGRRRPAWATAVAAALVGLVGLLGVGLGWSLRPPAKLTKLDLVDEELEAEDWHRPVLSPDGSRVAYFARHVLKIRELDRAEAREIPDTQTARDAFWSPDGSQVGFYKEKKLFRAAIDGGLPVPIAPVGGFVPGAGACWSDDGRIVYSRGNSPLYEVPAIGGESRVLLEPDREKGEDHFHGCSFLPDRRGMLFVVHLNSSSANTLALFAHGKVRYLLELPGEVVGDPAWSPGGHIVFHRGHGDHDGVWALPFDPAGLKATGDPFPIASGAVPSVSANGSLLYVPRSSGREDKLVWVLPDGTIDATAVEFDKLGREFALSPDGQRIALVGEEADLWVVELARDTRTQLTRGGGVSNPDWSRDGQRIAFARNNEIQVVDVASGAPPQAVGPGQAPAFSPDGRSIVVHRPGEDGIYELWLLDVAGRNEPRRLVRDETSARWATISPDGRFLAYSSGDGDTELFLTRFPDAVGRWQVSSHQGGWVRWSSDGKHLYYIGGATEDFVSRQLFEVDFEGDPEVRLGVRRPLFSTFDVGLYPAFATIDGDRFLMQPRDGSRSVARMVLVQSWYEEFR